MERESHLLADVEKLKKTVDGNGNPGLKTDVELLKINDKKRTSIQNTISSNHHSNYYAYRDKTIMTHVHGTKDCQTAQELKYKIMNSKGKEQKRFRELLQSHVKSCPICKGK